MLQTILKSSALALCVLAGACASNEVGDPLGSSGTPLVLGPPVTEVPLERPEGPRSPRAASDDLVAAADEMDGRSSKDGVFNPTPVGMSVTRSGEVVEGGGRLTDSIRNGGRESRTSASAPQRQASSQRGTTVRDDKTGASTFLPEPIRADGSTAKPVRTVEAPPQRTAAEIEANRRDTERLNREAAERLARIQKDLAKRETAPQPTLEPAPAPVREEPRVTRDEPRREPARTQTANRERIDPPSAYYRQPEPARPAPSRAEPRPTYTPPQQTYTPPPSRAPQQQAYTPPVGSNASALKQSGTVYLLGPGDELRVDVYNEETLSGTFTVDPSGSISLPLIGQMQAQGRTLRQFEGEIKEALNYYLVNPKVSLDLAKFRPFYIHGEVTKGGEYPYATGMHVLTAVGMAGGYTFRAHKKKVFIIRNGAGQEIEFPVSSETLIYPGDVVRVPERIF